MNRLQLQFMIMVLRCLRMLVYRQAYPDFKDFDSQWRLHTENVCDDAFGLIETLKSEERKSS